MVIIVSQMPIDGFKLSSRLFDDERVKVEMIKHTEVLEKDELINIELTKEEFLALLAHFNVIEMNMKK